MNGKIAGVIAVVLFSGSALVVSAQTKTTHKKVRTVTGCLQKTDDANEYKLTNSGGSYLGSKERQPEARRSRWSHRDADRGGLSSRHARREGRRKERSQGTRYGDRL